MERPGSKVRGSALAREERVPAPEEQNAKKEEKQRKRREKIELERRNSGRRKIARA